MIVKFLGAFLACTVMVVNLAALNYINTAMVSGASDELRRVVSVLANQSYHLMSSADTYLDVVVERISPGPINAASVRPVLQEVARSAVHAQAVMVFDPDGNMVAHSRIHPAPSVNVMDREYFRYFALAGAKPAVLYVSEPIPSRITGSKMIPLARQISNDRGGFRGVVMLALDVKHLSDLYARMYVPSGGEVFLRRGDGPVLARWPESSQDLKSGTRYLSFTEAVPKYGLVVGMTISLDGVAATWRPMAMAVVFSAIGCAVVILSVSVYTSSYLSRFSHWEWLVQQARPFTVIRGGKS